MTLFEDIVINPETTRIDCFRYREADGQEIEFSVVEQEGQTYFLKGVVESQLYKLFGLTLEGLTNVPWENRAGIIQKAFTKPFVLKCADGFPYAVVSTEYTTVRHKEVWGWAQDVLNQNMLAAELKGTLSTERKLFARFHTYKDYTKDRYSTYNNGFFIINSVRGAGSLGFGQSIFIPDEEVYLTGPTLHSIAHSGGLDRIESNFKSVFLSSFFSFKMPNWELLKILPQQGLTEKLDDILYKYKAAILRRLRESDSLYDAIVIASDIAKTGTAKTRLEIERLAYKVAFNEN